MRGLRAPAIIGIAAVALLAGCAAQEAADTEQMLAAAGFRAEPATTPAVQNQLVLLPSYQLLIRAAGAGGSQIEYVYADPEFCHCLYVGGPQQFQAFQRLAFQLRLAEEQIEAARALWSPPFWGSGLVIVHNHNGEHHHHEHHPDHDHDHDRHH
jgi:hypothetical protein